MTGGQLSYLSCYQPSLEPALSRAEFDAMVSELTRTCDKYAISVGPHVAFLFIPVLGLSVLPVMWHKMKRFRRKMEASCAQLNSQYGGRGVSLQVAQYRPVYDPVTLRNMEAHARRTNQRGPRTANQLCVMLEVVDR